MKVYKVLFDCVTITVIVNTSVELFDTLYNSDDNFFQENDKIMYRFDCGHIEECYIEDVTDKRGIIQWESH